jgi:two-component system, OmpR family, sensor kinase
MRSLARPVDLDSDFQLLAAHELRTPLTAVLVQLELLSDRLGGEDADIAEAALSSTRRVSRLVEQLLAVSRLDAGRSPASAPVDLAGVALDVADELECLAGGHRVVTLVEQATVLGVRDDLHRLVFNLVDNALSHTPEGTVVEVVVKAGRGVVTVVVQDNGPGIPEGLRGRVFERFVRGPSDGSEGSGLGLAIVSDVARAHGGTVVLEHPPQGSGARFVVRLPRARRPRPRTSLQVLRCGRETWQGEDRRALRHD